MSLNVIYIGKVQLLRRLIAPKLIVLFMVVFLATAEAQNLQNDINVTSNWLASGSNPRVTLGDGAVVDSANSTRINPYFANLGVQGFAVSPAHFSNIKNYMEWYWNHVSWPRQFNVVGCVVNPRAGALYGAINDFDVAADGTETPVPDPDAQHNLHPDSTDSYAGTFLSLAYAYYQTGDGSAQAYIKDITIGANGDRLDYAGEVVLATQQANGLTCARPDFNIQELMDNAEAYRGLRDLENLYAAIASTLPPGSLHDQVNNKASFYGGHADQMLNGIQTALWNGPNNEYFKDTTQSGVSQAVTWSQWYPDSASQVFPIALGVIRPDDPRATELWAKFQCHWQNQWTSLQADAFPWVIVGYTAALVGDTTDAIAFVKNVESKYVNTNFTGGSWSVNEAGYFMRLTSLLGAGPVTQVTMSSPGNCSTTGSSVNVQASASSTNGVSGWHIYDNGNNVFSAGAVSSINAPLTLTSGSHTLVIRAWDNVSGFGDQIINVTVQ